MSLAAGSNFHFLNKTGGSASRLQGSPHGLNPSDAGTDELHMLYFAASFCRSSSLSCVISAPAMLQRMSAFYRTVPPDPVGRDDAPQSQ
jgi:hypothetical protein